MICARTIAVLICLKLFSKFHTPFTCFVSLFAYSSLSLSGCHLSTSGTNAAFTNCFPDFVFSPATCAYDSACVSQLYVRIIEEDLLGICLSGLRCIALALHRVGSWGVLLARAGPTGRGVV